MKVLATLASLALLATVSILPAAPALKEVPAPTAPLVAAVPTNAQWAVVAREPAESKPALDAAGKPAPSFTKSALIQKVETTKTGNLKRDRISFVNGESKEEWYLNGTVQLAQQGARVIVAPVIGTWNLSGPNVPSGFPGVSWVAKGNYVQAETFENQPCYHYLLNQGDEGTSEAWINVETKNPVGYRRQGVTYIFEFAPPPDQPLSLPPNFLAARESYLKQQEQGQRLQKELSGR